jgi:hypothetical protein
LPRAVGGLLSRRHRASFGRLDDDRPWATAPGETRGPGCGLMAPPGLALLAAPARLASPRLLPTPCGWPLVAGSLVEVLCFPRPCQAAMQGVRQRSMPQPPAAPIAGPAMAPPCLARRGDEQARQSRTVASIPCGSARWPCWSRGWGRALTVPLQPLHPERWPPGR